MISSSHPHTESGTFYIVLERYGAKEEKEEEERKLLLRDKGEAGDRIQWIRTVATKPASLRLLPGNSQDRKNQLLQVVLASWFHTQAMVRGHMLAHAQKITVEKPL